MINTVAPDIDKKVTHPNYHNSLVQQLQSGGKITSTRCQMEMDMSTMSINTHTGTATMLNKVDGGASLEKN